jgi:hypothetical protein
MTFSITTHYTEKHYAECRNLFIVMLNVIVQSVALRFVVALVFAELWHRQLMKSLVVYGYGVLMFGH